MRVLAVALLAAVLPAAAAELRSVEFDRLEDRYVFESEAWFDVGVEAIYDVLLDYDLSEQFSSAIDAARNLPPDEEGRRRFYVRNRGCVLLFCKSFERTGTIEHEPYTSISASVDPAVSDFEFSDETWTFRPEDDGTTVHYRVEFEPKFWVPPVIGPWVIRRTLASHGGDAIDRIEAIARENAAGGERPR